VDLNTNAFRIVEALTSGKKEHPRSTVARVAGRKGGAARAKALSSERRSAIATKASKARWGR